MDDLISRQAAIWTVRKAKDKSEAHRMLIQLPTVDAVPVVHGKWIDETFKPWGLVYHPYKCDQCGENSETNSNFCPNCGADMRKDGDHNE
jgi:rubrerythrin